MVNLAAEAVNLKRELQADNKPFCLFIVVYDFNNMSDTIFGQ